MSPSLLGPVPDFSFFERNEYTVIRGRSHPRGLPWSVVEKVTLSVGVLEGCGGGFYSYLYLFKN